MKIKCDQHSRRVHIFNDKMVHRSDGSTCPGPSATIGSETFTPSGVKLFGLVRPPRSVS